MEPWKESRANVAQRRSSPLRVHVGYVGPERHGAFKLAGVDQDEDQHGVDHHRHPEVLQDPAPPLKVHLDEENPGLLHLLIKEFYDRGHQIN